ILEDIKKKNITVNLKTKAMQSSIDVLKTEIGYELRRKYALSIEDVAKFYMLVQYCYTVFSLEMRQQLWPYEYMSFSRRNGELWERFCKAAWDYTTMPNLKRIEAPHFSQVQNAFTSSINNIISNADEKANVINITNTIFNLVGDINMIEDEMFKIGSNNYIIDFKSGFGSNEKGNTLRLLAVGQAYKHWDPKVTLLFLVRQEENNNYLEKIKRSNLWEVHCGDSTYRKIDELTGSGISDIRENAIDFENDLSPQFWQYLTQNNLTHYLKW
ncbi:hypothetical protein QFX92_004508, partial [Salmonella enterica subsp. enterica serovar Johannesburg]|nr:hypothetical protein [Salmonella enterica subsp. enterica serovar Johannesburg]EKY4967614.1 hypothetical protein [Salmonella enterica subsp. enterica serovar Johannesburg]